MKELSNLQIEKFEDVSKSGVFIEDQLDTSQITDDPLIQEYNIQISKLTIRINQTRDPNERARLVNERDTIHYNKTMYLLKLYLKKFLFYTLLFVLISFNLISVAVSMSCSLGETFTYRILSAVYAFIFGIIYLLVNYKYYRLRTDGACVIQPNNPFAV